jgi:hypothetical protein
VAYGELLIGIALIGGAFVGIAAFFGAFMNFNFMLRAHPGLEGSGPCRRRLCAAALDWDSVEAARGE